MRQASPENVGGQVAAFLTAKRAIRNYPVIRHSLHWRGNVLATPLAGDYKRIKAGGRRVKHGSSIGEETAKVSTALFMDLFTSNPEGRLAAS
jgi:hypothetical protein